MKLQIAIDRVTLQKQKNGKNICRKNRYYRDGGHL